MKVGFTGTQNGMTIEQERALVIWVYENRHKIVEVHHGMCIGADEQFDKIANQFGFLIVGHPGYDHARRSPKQAALHIKDVRLPKPYLDRNHDIVDETDILVATPKEKIEQLRSGTWSTVRYAKKKKKKVIMFFPGGERE